MVETNEELRAILENQRDMNPIYEIAGGNMARAKAMWYELMRINSDLDVLSEDWEH